MRSFSFALLLTLVATPALSEARLAPNGLRVHFEGTTFEVFTEAGWTREALFCAAGTVARIAGAKYGQYLVVRRGVERSSTLPNRRSAIFELVDRSAVADRSVFTFLSGFEPGARKSVGAAEFACEQENFLRNDF